MYNKVESARARFLPDSVCVLLGYSLYNCIWHVPIHLRKTHKSAEQEEERIETAGISALASHFHKLVQSECVLYMHTHKRTVLVENIVCESVGSSSV